MSQRDNKFALRDSQSAHRASPFVRSAILTAYADAARRVGLEPFRMARKAGVPDTALRQPDLGLPADRLVTLLESSADESDRSDFGLLVGGAVRLSMLGPLGLLMRQHRTVGDAVAALARYLPYQDTTIEIRLRQRRGALVLELAFLSTRVGRSRVAEDMAVSVQVQTLRGLLGESWSPELVCFVHGAPADLAAYAPLARHVEFGHAFAAVVITSEDAAQRLSDADPAMVEELERYIERAAPPGPRSAVDRVRDLIIRLLPEGYCTIEHVGERLGVDRRTVHRWLAAEGQSFSGLVETIRRERAASELRDGHAPLGEVAERLGFSSLSTFSRWFRGAFGVRASDFRQSGPT